ncbi:MAG: hypothetical protein AAF989_16290, partial [Planctomycetota bacterium]
MNAFDFRSGSVLWFGCVSAIALGFANNDRLNRQATTAWAQETAPTSDADATVTLLRRLTDVGLQIEPGQRVTIPAPIMLADESNVRGEDLAGRLGWARFSKATIVAPVWMDLEYLKDDHGRRIGHSVHFRFVVHQPLSKLRDRDWMQSVFGESSEDADGGYRKVGEDELPMEWKRGAESIRHGFVEVPLMNRVVVRGLVSGTTEDHGAGTVMAWRLEDTVPSASSLSSTWAAIERDDLGAKREGPMFAYRGAGGFLNLQPLSSVDESMNNACLVEGRLILREPEGWFGGSNFLRSKFSILIQEAA